MSRRSPALPRPWLRKIHNLIRAAQLSDAAQGAIQGDDGQEFVGAGLGQDQLNLE